MARKGAREVEVDLALGREAGILRGGRGGLREHRLEMAVGRRRLQLSGAAEQRPDVLTPRGGDAQPREVLEFAVGELGQLLALLHLAPPALLLLLQPRPVHALKSLLVLRPSRVAEAVAVEARSHITRHQLHESIFVGLPSRRVAILREEWRERLFSSSFRERAAAVTGLITGYCQQIAGRRGGCSGGRQRQAHHPCAEAPSCSGIIQPWSQVLQVPQRPPGFECSCTGRAKCSS